MFWIAYIVCFIVTVICIPIVRCSEDDRDYIKVSDILIGIFLGAIPVLSWIITFIAFCMLVLGLCLYLDGKFGFTDFLDKPVFRFDNKKEKS